MTDINRLIIDAFFTYAKKHTNLSQGMLVDYLQKAADYCQLSQPLIGMTDLKVVRNAQQKVAEGRLLHFRYGEDAKSIRHVTQLYFNFIKSYHERHVRHASESIPLVQPVEQIEQSQHKTIISSGRSNNLPSLDVFKIFLIQEQHLAERTAGNYCTSIRMIEKYIQENDLPYSLVNANACDVRNVVDMLMTRADFVRINDERHHQYSAAMVQYTTYLEKKTQTTESRGDHKQSTSYDTIKDDVAQIEGNNSAIEQVGNHILLFMPEAFPHGIRPASIIDINKLKRVYQAKFDEEIPDEVDLTALLTSAGLTSGEKVYFLTDDQKLNLRNLIIGIIEEGYRVIFYSELLSLHSELFESCHIYECSLMRTVLKNILPEYIYKAEWMLVDQYANEVDEITKAFGDDVVLTYQQLKSRCPYLTLGDIKWALSRSDKFVWSSPETYAQTDLIELDQNEVSEIVNRIVPLINSEGYFSLAQLPIEESCAMNPYVSSNAVRDAIYIRFLSNQFTRNGLIVKRPEIHLSTYQLLETWLNGLEQVTLFEIENYEHELTGHHLVLGIEAASNVMVRIDHDHYVSDASIHFEVEAVDHAISLFVGERIIPISAITSYTSFPEVPGYIWNLYLVESFLRRFSKRFRIDGGPAQMSYVGGVYSVARRFENYADLLAHAVLQDSVSLTEEAIGHYLTERKYILRRGEIVRRTLERAKILNEQRGESGVWI